MNYFRFLWFRLKWFINFFCMCFLVSFLSFLYFMSFAEFILCFFGGYFFCFCLVDFLSGFGVEPGVVSEIEFSRIVFVLYFLLKGLNFTISHTFLSSWFGKFSTAGLVTRIVTVLTLTFEAAFSCRVSVVRLVYHRIDFYYFRVINKYEIV